MKAVAKMVQRCMTFIDKTPNMDEKLSLINTLIQVTEGKVLMETDMTESCTNLTMGNQDLCRDRESKTHPSAVENQRRGTEIEGARREARKGKREIVSFERETIGR